MKMNNDVEFTIGEEENERMFEGIIFLEFRQSQLFLGCVLIVTFPQ